MAKESSASRRARVKFQLRDRKGRWIEMGRGVKWYSPRLGREVSGTVVGTKGRNAIVDITSEPKGRDGKSQQVSVKGTDIEVIESKASLGAPAPKPPKQDIPTEKAKLAEARSEQQERSRTIAAPAKSKAKADDKKGSQAEDDAEDAPTPEEDPDIADLEDEDLDLGDLEDDETAEEDEEQEEAGPTSVEDLEATIEELEAVVEEVSSGDLDADEIEAKLAEEIYEVVGNDNKKYDLDVKKFGGKWSYRLKDEGGGETRAMIPADENDSVEAGAQLNAAMNGKTKAKAKASTTLAKPKEEVPVQPEAETKPEVPEATPEAPKAEAKPKGGRKPKVATLDLTGLKNVRKADPSRESGQYVATDVSPELLKRVPVGTAIVADRDGADGNSYLKVGQNRWARMNTVASHDTRELSDSEMMGPVGEDELDQINLPGHEDNPFEEGDVAKYTEALDKQKAEKDAQRDAEIKAREEKEAKAAADSKAGSESPEAKTVEAPKTTTPVPEGEQKGLFPEPKKANRKTIVETRKEFEGLPEGTKIHFADAMGENPESYQKFKDAQDKDVWAKMADADEVIDPKFYSKEPESNEDRELLTNAEMGKSHRDRPYDKEVPPAYDNREAVRKEVNDKRLNQPVKHDVPLQRDSGTDGTGAAESASKATKNGSLVEVSKPVMVKVSDLKVGDSFIPVTKVDSDYIDANTPKDNWRDADYTAGSPKADPETVSVQVDTKPATIKSINDKGEPTFEMDSVSQRRQGSRYGENVGGEKTASSATINKDAYVLPDTPDNRKMLADAGMSHLSDTPEAPESSGAPAEAPEAAPERPEATEAPATPKADSDAPAAPQTAPGRMTRDELLKEVTDLEIKGAKTAGTGDYDLSPAESARRAALRKELDTREGEAPTEVASDETDEGAAALAAVGVERTEPRTLPGEKFPPTRQQQDVIDAVMAGKDTVVQAKAGAGKTTTLQAIAARVAEANADKKIVYVAFNSSVQKEAEARMPGNVEARTGHSIGFGWVGKDVNDRYNDGGLELDEDVAKHIGITGTYAGDPGSDDSTLYPADIAAAAMLTVDKFAYNAEDDINEDHLPDSMFGTSPEAKAAVIDAANKIWEDVKAPDGKIKLTQDHMRKMWALSRPDFGQEGAGLRRKADMLFIDEAQDTPPVLAKVIADQKMQKVIVGDADQAIYAFSGATDFLSKAEKDLELPLNRSWRFGAPVADAGNRFLELLGSKGRVVGGGNSKISEGQMKDADAVLVRTNAGALGEMVAEGSRGRIVGVEKKTIDKFQKMADTMDWLKSKDEGQTPIPKPTKVLPELAAYKNWEHVLNEAEKGDKPNLSMFTRLDETYGSKGIRDALKNVIPVGGKNDKPGKSSDGIGGNLNGVDMDDNGKTTVARGNSFMNKDDLKAVGFKFMPDPSGEVYRSGQNKGQVKKSWQATGSTEQRAKMVEAFGKRLGVDTSGDSGAEPITPDVIISTAHKAKGLEWKKVRIGDDFPQPKVNKATGKVTMPDDENLRLAYVAVTRAEAELDPGSLGYVYNYTKENGGTPEPADKPIEQNEVTEPPISAADDSDYVPDSDDRVADLDEAATPAESSDAPEAAPAPEQTPEAVPETAPEAPETSPEVEEAPEPTPAPAEAAEPVETPVAPAPAEATPVDDATPVDAVNEDGLTPAEAAYAEKLEKAISDGYRTGMGNIQALQERLDEIYDRGAARQRGEDPDEAPEAAPEVQPAEEKESDAPVAEEEVAPEVVVEEEPEPTPEAPAETETEVEVEEESTEDGPQGDASDGEEEVEDGPTDLESFEATASELFETFQSVQKTPRTPQELEDLLEAEIYLLRGEDGNGYEFGLDVDDKGKWSYVLADEEGNELERYNVMTTSPEEAGQKAFERVNGSPEPEAVASGPYRDEVMSVEDLKKIRMDKNLDEEYVDKLAKQFAKDGVGDNYVIVEETGGEPFISDGHHMLEAAERAGIAEIPVRIFANTPEGRMAATSAAVDLEREKDGGKSRLNEEAPVDPADATPEAEEEIVEDADRVEPEEAPEVDPEVLPEPAPMPEVEDTTAPDAQTPEELPAGGTAAPEPDARPVHPVKLKAHNYPDGTQITSGRTSEVIEKTKGKWHVAGSPSKSADPMKIATPVVTEMPLQSAESFDKFDGNIDDLEPGDIIRTQDGSQAAIVGVRDGKVMVLAHGLPARQKALRPSMVSVDPSKIVGVQKFNAAPENAVPAAPAVPRARTRSAGGAPIKDVNGYETKIGDRVMTAIGQGEVIALRPASGPNGSVFVRLDDGKEKSFRSNKFTNTAGADSLEGDDPATMEIGAEGTGADGRKFLVGKGNKPIHKGDRVALADGRIGTVAGIYAGAKSAGVTLEDGTTTRKRVSTLDAIDYEAPEKGPDTPEDGPDGGGDGGPTPDAPQSGPEAGAEAPAAPAFNTYDLSGLGIVGRDFADRYLNPRSENRADNLDGLKGLFKEFSANVSAELPEGVSVESAGVQRGYGGTTLRLDFTFRGSSGDVVGFAQRTMSTKTGGLSVGHDSFTLLTGVQNKGVGSAFLKESDNLYRQLGVEKITLHANVDVGGYAWARAGFNFSNEGSANQAKGLLFKADARVEKLQGTGGVSDEDIAALADLRRRVDAGEAITPFEFSQIGAGTTNFGKNLLLNHDWFGEKVLEPLDGPDTSSDVPAPEAESTTPDTPAAPEAEAVPETPEAETAPAAPEAPAAAPSFAYGNSEAAQYFESTLAAATVSGAGGYWNHEKYFNELKKYETADHPVFSEDWEERGAKAFSTLMAGEASDKELSEASATIGRLTRKAIYYAEYVNKNPRDLRTLSDQLRTAHSEYYEYNYKSKMGSLAAGGKGRVTDVTNYTADSVDFSGFDWSTSKFNPSSERSKAIGDRALEVIEGVNLRSGVRVRNKTTGEYGTLTNFGGNEVDNSGGVDVHPVKMPKDMKGGRYGIESWNVDEIEEDQSEWPKEPIDFSTTSSLGELNRQMAEAYPDMHIDFSGLPLEFAHNAANTMSRLASKFPMLRSTLTSVHTERLTGQTTAAAGRFGSSQYGVDYRPTRMILSTKGAATVVKGTRDSVNANWLNPVKEGNEVASVLTHETGHLLEYMSGDISEDDIIDILRSVYPDYRNRDKELSDMVDRGILPRYPVASGQLDVAELVAEAFADAELNATDARPLSKLLHQYLMERLQEG